MSHALVPYDDSCSKNHVPHACAPLHRACRALGRLLMTTANSPVMHAASTPVAAFKPTLRQCVCAAAIVLLPYAAMAGILLLNG